MSKSTLRIQFKNGSNLRSPRVDVLVTPQGSRLRIWSPEISDDMYPLLADVCLESYSRLTAGGPVLRWLLVWASDVSSMTHN